MVLGQAASHAARMDVDLKRTYLTLVHRRGRSKAQVAVARKRPVRLFIMLRDQIDYAEFRRRGRQQPVLEIIHGLSGPLIDWAALLDDGRSSTIEHDIMRLVREWMAGGRLPPGT